MLPACLREGETRGGCQTPLPSRLRVLQSRRGGLGVSSPPSPPVFQSPGGGLGGCQTRLPFGAQGVFDPVSAMNGLRDITRRASLEPEVSPAHIV